MGLSTVFGRVPNQPTAQAMASIDPSLLELLVQSPALARLSRLELLELFQMTLEAVSASA